jgi:hypothetical protein
MKAVTPIGTTNHQNKHIAFGINETDRAGHIYCLGKTGTGKSTLLLNMAISDIEKGNGIGIIDPHGDLANTILEYIPKERIKDVIYFNVADRQHPIPFNPLYKVQPENRHLAASTIVTTLKKIWIDSWGPRLEHILRNTLLTLTYYPHATLLDITVLLTNQLFRQRVLSYVSDDSLIDFWYKEFEPLSPHFKNEIIAPITNKVGLFATHPILKQILGQRHSAFSIASVMDKGKIFIANLSKGYLGEEGTALLGSLLVTQFQSASVGRAKQQINTRKTFYLYIDEMHSFMTMSFADILSESRKYGLSLFLTHQFTGQLQEELLSAILGNIGTLITFRVGTQDAFVLKEEFHPIFSETDLLNIPQYSIYLKLLIDGTTSQPFSATTHALTSKRYGFKKTIMQYCIKRYAVFPEGNKEIDKLMKEEPSKIKDTATLFDLY